MATTTKKKATTRKPEKCATCDGSGEVATTVRVGARKGRATDHKQLAMCTDCLGSGEAN
jgi:DnaJ-class molecular chaperone